MHPIILESVHDHEKAGTVPAFLIKLDEVLTTTPLTYDELYQIHWKCILLVLFKKYPDAIKLSKKVLTLRQQLRGAAHIAKPSLVQQ